MRNWTRQHELGRILLDVAKYIATGVVICGLFAPQVNVLLIVSGAVLAASFAGVGFYIIPSEETHGSWFDRPHQRGG